MQEELRQKFIDLQSVKNSCRFCNVKSSCFPHGINGLDQAKLGAEVIIRPLAARGQHLFTMGAEEDGIYVVRAGTLKSYIISPHGDEHVIGFHVPGEMIGLDAFENGKHVCGVVALQPSNVCKVPNALLQDICHAAPEIFSEMRRLIGAEVFENQQTMLTLTKHKAVARLASFILDWIRRCKRDHMSGEPVDLPMSRMDIASYIGLTAESLSRAFRKLQQEDIISVSGSAVTVTASNRLREIASDN